MRGFASAWHRGASRVNPPLALDIILGFAQQFLGSIPLKDYAYQEARYTMLARSQLDAARKLLREAQDDVERQWRVYSARAAMPGRSETPHIAPPEKEEAIAMSVNGKETEN